MAATTELTRTNQIGLVVARLRFVLRINAANSIVFGALMAAMPETVDDVLGTARPGWIRLVGLGLVGFAAFVGWLSTASPKVLKKLVPQVVLGDVGWVVGSVVTVLLGWYSGAGNVTVLAMAVAVDAFAALQWWLWRRLQR
ncbi:hypothetical protein [Ilumatobacter sp.]|uniref:hypothetical protein n=1 Tax=Ilumatobacter sp. TaxID=1967498 RepID=UPI0037520828